jgi:16S rRNA (adenine1518-N6/adenine1519-N6)-dimethyltransferase
MTAGEDGSAPGSTGTSPAEMLARYGLAPSKQRGQNFLSDPNVTRKVVDAARVSPDDIVMEIGPGFGALTFGLARAARHVVAVELDKGVARAFREEYGDQADVTLVEGDALEFDLKAVARENGVERLVVVGNIPYNVTSPLIRKLIDDRSVVSRVVLMVQSEVCDRIASVPGDQSYSGLSVVTRYHASVRRLFTVRRTCFHPRPKVDSGVVEISFEQNLDRASDPAVFERVVAAAFGKRRKMLRQALAAILNESGLNPSEIEAVTGIEMSRRGETLSVEEFDVLAAAVSGR